MGPVENKRNGEWSFIGSSEATWRKLEGVQLELETDDSGNDNKGGRGNKHDSKRVGGQDHARKSESEK